VKSKGRPGEKNAEGNRTITSVLSDDSVVQLLGLLEKLQQPLPWEIVTADMSRVAMRAHRGS